MATFNGGHGIFAENNSLLDQGIFEQNWRYMTDNYSKFAIATWGSLLAHEIAYFGVSFPFFIFQFLPFMQRFKIQTEPETWTNQWKCFKLIIFSHIFIQLPMMSGIFTFTEYMGIPYEYEHIPPWYQTVGRCLLCFIIEDIWHYFFHRILHQGVFYRRIHKIHHSFQSPFSIAAEYAHPLETVVLGIGFFIGVLLFSNHIFFMWVWMCFRVFEANDAHSGYNLWHPLHLLPFYGGAHFHDFHHRNFVGNYSSTFTYLDTIFGTNHSYKKFYNLDLENEDLRNGAKKTD